MKQEYETEKGSEHKRGISNILYNSSIIENVPYLLMDKGLSIYASGGSCHSNSGQSCASNSNSNCNSKEKSTGLEARI